MCHHTSAVTPSQRAMRLFYEWFPYPGRFSWIKPNPKRLLLAHAGFGELCTQVPALALLLWQERRCSLPLSQAQRRQIESQIEQMFSTSAKILLVGCGTDEPLLYRVLHPQNPITAIDLSGRSIELAARKIRLHSCQTVDFTCADAAFCLEENPSFRYQLIQCFGVLHHQSDPLRLFRAMVAALAPGACLRIMIYSRTGRRAERYIQGRFQRIWKDPCATKDQLLHRYWRLLQVSVLVVVLWIWQVIHFVFTRSSLHYRFGYLGVSRRAIADAFLHPSDPGLDPENVVSWADSAGLKMVFCEALLNGRGWVSGIGSTAAVWSEIAHAERRGDLLSNVTMIFKREK